MPRPKSWRSPRRWAGVDRGLLRRGLRGARAAGRDRQGGAGGAQAIVIACFDDTGLDAARALAGIPVIVSVRRPFGDILHRPTLFRRHHHGTLAAPGRTSRASLWHGQPLQGAGCRCAGAVAGGSEFERPRPAAQRDIGSAEDDRAEAIVLAVPAWRISRRRFGRSSGARDRRRGRCRETGGEPDCAGLSTAKRGAYATPVTKTYHGDLARFSPLPWECEIGRGCTDQGSVGW